MGNGNGNGNGNANDLLRKPVRTAVNRLQDVTRRVTRNPEVRDIIHHPVRGTIRAVRKRLQGRTGQGRR